MPDIIKKIADMVIGSMRADKCDFDVAYTAVMKNNRNLDWKETKKLVGSELGKRRKTRKLKPTPSPYQMELFLGISRTQALRDAAEHEASLCVGLSEEDRS